MNDFPELLSFLNTFQVLEFQDKNSTVKLKDFLRISEHQKTYGKKHSA